jgi:hypothetical protein
MKNFEIDDNLIAKYISGRTDKHETALILQAASENEELREELDFLMNIPNEEMCDHTDDENSHCIIIQMPESKTTAKAMPMPPVWMIYSKAAKSRLDDMHYNDESDCVVKCEQFIMHRHGIDFTLEDLRETSRKHHWLQKGGTHIYNIGRLIEESHLAVVRKIESTKKDLLNELQAGCEVILVVNAAKFYGKSTTSDKPNHAVVAHLNEDKKLVVYDPMEETDTSDCTFDTLMEAWKDSNCFMVSATDHREYNPQPLDLSEEHVDQEYEDITEFMAEIFHDNWAWGRFKDGYTLGMDREKKQNPDLVPYHQLPEKEKEFDRVNARLAVAALKKLGYKITRE